MAKRKIIIDCDAGVDDAQAILLALSAQDVEVIAITCVAGNTPIDKVCVNVLKVLELCNRTDIPVFKGAVGPLLGKNSRCYYYVSLNQLAVLRSDKLFSPESKSKLNCLVRVMTGPYPGHLRALY